MTKQEFAALSHEERERLIRRTNPATLRDMDGVVFINIDTQAKTELGRFLASYTKAPFEHPHYGHFSSIEAFWNWLCSGDSAATRDDNLRPLSMYSAKSKGRQNKWNRVQNFYGEIVFATYVKIRSNRDMFEKIIESELPFVMYYVTKEKTLAIPAPKRKWLLAGIEEIRIHLRDQGLSVPYSVSQSIIRMK